MTPRLPACAPALMAALALSATAVGQSPAGGGPIQVTLLGTGNPRPSMERFGPSLLVEAGPTRILVDAGRGVAQRLFQIGAAEALRGIDLLLLTHLHSDHVVGLPDAWLTAWIFGRTRPWPVLGPPGTREMCGHLEKAFAWDLASREVDERRTRAGAALEARDVLPGVVFESGGVRVTAFAVDHGEYARPAYGFRIDYAGRSVVISGDTKYHPPMAEVARGSDVFVHEVLSPEVELARTQVPDPKAVERIIERHATPAQVGRLFAAAAPRLGVLTHVVPSPATAEDLLPALRQAYDGPVAVGYDLMTIVVGDRIEVFPRRTVNDK